MAVPGSPGAGAASPPAALQAGSGGCGEEFGESDHGGPRGLPEGPRNSERRRFRSCRPRESEGPRALCSHLHRLCREWLRPERSGKAEVVDRVVLEQLLALLPPELAGWLQECGAESCAQAVALAEGFLLGPTSTQELGKERQRIPEERNPSCPEAGVKSALFISALFNHHSTHHSQPLIAVFRTRMSRHSGPNVLSSELGLPFSVQMERGMRRGPVPALLKQRTGKTKRETEWPWGLRVWELDQQRPPWPFSSEAERRTFCSCRLLGAPGLCSRLHQLCREWLWPERSGKAEIVDRVVLEQLLALLPPELAGWLRECGAESCAQAVALAEGFLLGPTSTQELGKGWQVAPKLDKIPGQPATGRERLPHRGCSAFLAASWLGLSRVKSCRALPAAGRRAGPGWAVGKEARCDLHNPSPSAEECPHPGGWGAGRGKPLPMPGKQHFLSCSGHGNMGRGPRKAKRGGGGRKQQKARRLPQRHPHTPMLRSASIVPSVLAPLNLHSPASTPLPSVLPAQTLADLLASAWNRACAEGFSQPWVASEDRKAERSARRFGGSYLQLQFYASEALRERSSAPSREREGGLRGNLSHLDFAEAMDAPGSPWAGAAAAPVALQTGGDDDPNGLPEGPQSSEAARRRFRSCRPREDEEPRALCNRLHRLCLGWLRPERNGKAEILDRVVLEQLLALLPPELAGWLRECEADSCAQAVALAEGFLLGPPPSSVPREPPGESWQLQEPFMGEFSTVLQGRGAPSFYSEELPFSNIKLGPPCQDTHPFEEVAVDFTEEEWALLDCGQKALCKEVMLEVSKNVAALGDGDENDNHLRLFKLQMAVSSKSHCFSFTLPKMLHRKHKPQKKQPSLAQRLGGERSARSFGGSDLQAALRLRSSEEAELRPFSGKGRREERVREGGLRGSFSHLDFAEARGRMGSPGSSRAGAAAAPAALQAGGEDDPNGLPEVPHSSEAERRRFRSYRPQEDEGPRALCSRLHRLCRGWLRPERSGKAEMLDRVVLEQLLALLPPELAGWLRECGAESCAQAVALAEGFLLGPPPSCNPREPPGESRQLQQPFMGEISTVLQGRGDSFFYSEELPFNNIKLGPPCQLQEPFMGEISTVLQGRGAPSFYSEELPFSNIKLGPPCQDTHPFEEVAVDFTEEEWALLDCGQKTLYSEVMLEVSKNMAALGDGDGLENENDNQLRLFKLQMAEAALSDRDSVGIGERGNLRRERLAAARLRLRRSEAAEPQKPGEGRGEGEERAGECRRDEGRLRGSFPAGNGLPEGLRSSEAERRCFRSCRPREDEGPRALCSRLHRLCREWLRPERGGKAEMLDRVVLEQLLDLLPPDLAGWLRECGAESCAQAVALAEGFLLAPPPSSAPRELPGEGRQLQELIMDDISAELQGRGDRSSPSKEVVFSRIQVGPTCQDSVPFEEVAVDFTEEEKQPSLTQCLGGGRRSLRRERVAAAFLRLRSSEEGEPRPFSPLLKPGKGRDKERGGEGPP
ncbi:zinc finger protein [Crotalus adamanteus]|uniref:Zinc finger protein n=1 Tax=Crotalus adamanteus TaxID=8729 RepID=A0AAW1BTR6_CROAD